VLRRVKEISSGPLSKRAYGRVPNHYESSGKISAFQRKYDGEEEEEDEGMDLHSDDEEEEEEREQENQGHSQGHQRLIPSDHDDEGNQGYGRGHRQR